MDAQILNVFFNNVKLELSALYITNFSSYLRMVSQDDRNLPIYHTIKYEKVGGVDKAIHLH